MPCGKKNPCKICRDTVTNRNGLQCQGACRSWIHYGCTSFTPGKIKDIKGRYIRITCPCPDCKTNMPREYRTDKGAPKTPCCASAQPIKACGASCRQNCIPLTAKFSTSKHDVNDGIKYVDSLANMNKPTDKLDVMPATTFGGGQRQDPMMRQLCTAVGNLNDTINDLISNMKTITDRNDPSSSSCPAAQPCLDQENMCNKCHKRRI